MSIVQHSITLPESVSTGFILFCRLPLEKAPSQREVVDIAKSWATANLPHPLSELIPQWYMLPTFDVRSCPASQLPPEMQRSFLMMLEPERVAEFDQATLAIFVRCDDILLHPRLGLWTSLSAVRALQDTFGGIAINIDSRRALPTRSFEEYHDHLIPRMRDFTALPYSKGPDGLYLITTLGMNSFGLPNLRLGDVPEAFTDPAIRIVMGIGQTLTSIATQENVDNASKVREISFPLDIRLTQPQMQIARGLPVEEPSPGKGAETIVRLEMELNRDGTPKFLHIIPPASWTGGKSDWLFDICSTFFQMEQPYTAGKLDDASMEAAHRRAIAELPDIKARFLAGQIQQGRLLVKHGFSTGGIGHEYMWVSVRSWAKGKLVGELVNTPARHKDLRHGRTVTIPESEIFDWMVGGPNGTEGGYTNSQGTVSNEDDVKADGAKVALAKLNRISDPDLAAKVKKAYYDDCHRRFGSAGEFRFIVGVALAITIIGFLAVFGLWKFDYLIPALVVTVVTAFLGLKYAREAIDFLPERARRQRLLDEGEPVNVWLVDYDANLATPGSNAGRCRGILMFDATAEDTAAMENMSAQLREMLRQLDDKSEVARIARRHMDDGRRTQLPIDFTGGRVVYILNFVVEREALPGAQIRLPIIPCVAVRGALGPEEPILWSTVLKSITANS